MNKTFSVKSIDNKLEKSYLKVIFYSKEKIINFLFIKYNILYKIVVNLSLSNELLYIKIFGAYLQLLSYICISFENLLIIN